VAATVEDQFNSLKSHKTGKEMVGKAWRKHAYIWKNLAKKLGGSARAVTVA
jgi:hypothetical protein